MNHLVRDIFIFMGPPGAGKGSLASLCVENFGWLQISTGNLCRKHIADQTKIGKEIDLIIKSGKLINDDLVTSMVTEWINENADKASGLIFDGYPRTIAQADLFDTVLKTQFSTVRIRVILFDLTDDVVVNRLCSRYICRNKDCQAVYSLACDANLESQEKPVCGLCSSALIKREDDSEAAVRKRLEIYHRHEQQLIDFYRNNGTEIITLDASQPLAEVFDSFVKNIKQ